jgi:hypothetical protein
VDVSAAAAGIYTNTIPAGALVTSVGSNAGAATANLTVFSGGPGTFPPDENFDENPAPLLPSGWVSSGTNDWTTTSTASDTAPNAAFAQDVGSVSDFTLDSPVFTPVANQSVTFHHQFNLEDTFDGAVLEISIGGGAFADIVDAGGSFTTGGYVEPISDCCDNPLANRNAWSGDSGGFITTTALLPATAVGQPTQLRFRTADDSSFAASGVPGWWVDSIHLDVGAPSNPPLATVTPTSLAFTVASNATDTDTLNIANAAGSDPLTFSIEARGTSKLPTLKSVHTLSKAKSRASRLAGKTLVPRPLLGAAAHGVKGKHRASTPWVPTGSIAFQLDDGSAEDSIGFGTAGPPATESGAVWINRFNATAALTVDSISIFWGDTTLAGGDLTGLQANLVVYYDADADGDASNAVRLGTDDLVTITTTGDFQTYTTNFSVPGAGDVYIGFVDQWALAGSFSPRLFPAAIDETASQGMSHLSAAGTPPTDIVNLGNNDNNGVIDDFGLPGNWLIRATGTGGGSGGPCTGPVVPWLTATPASGSVNGGSNTDVTITANPSAGTLDAGTYTAELCITTNDPTQALISVPVSLTVTAVAATPCNGGADEIFCDGFDGSGGGPFTQPVVDPSFEATTTDAGTNPDWDSLDTNAGAAGGTVFYSATNFGIPVHTGDFAAWFGGWGGGGETQHFSQSVTLPNGGPLFINYFRQTAVAPDAPSNMVVSVDGTAVETTDLSTQLDSDFVLHSIDISTFADGGAHVIKFQYDYASGTVDGNTFVDDVTIDQSSTPGKR